MNYKLPPLPPQSSKVFSTAVGTVKVLAYNGDDMQAYASAAIEAQGVLADDNDAEATVNKTNAVLASRYFELLNVVEQYEKNGVTCQTFRHFVSAPCAECNSPGRCGKQASVVQQEPVAFLYQLEYGASVVNRKVSEWRLNYPFGVCGADYIRSNDEGVSCVREIPLYTHPAQQTKPQPLSDGQIKQQLASEYNRGWDDCEATHDGP